MKLVIENLSKSFGNHVAVKNVSFELTEGVYGFLGSNGSGKSTLMRMLASVSKPSAGRVLYNGKDIAVLEDEYRELLGYSPQTIGYYKNFTVEKMMYYIASLKGIDRRLAKEKTSELLTLVNLFNERKVKIKKLSGGMKQRVGIAQALLNDPSILIVDEPTAGLDPKERVRFRNLLSKISTNRIVLLSTHIVSDIEYIAKEIMILKEGTLIQKEEPRTLLEGIKHKVWTVIVDESEIANLQSHYRCGNIMPNQEKFELRLVSDTKPHPNAVFTQPNLEDLYLYYFDEEVNAS
ncbi:ABC transporter ATP-binding protein [Anaerobacillus sp. 1_MG-2023]|uniref:ABC transporter ATP-binding protein n=1 Tax=Anaerobacillus sp. 1_MG-2023 TaxID=3062655 RepID=UPI0026E45BFD|nr:ABC transporter ATP-binding protein [Anaerobacillus sp. 1_MG-2023]MDO6658731.1 ABC transporter ATP-binding protein [Anaerobacillus sp. 1_MG-2023]